jgi:hypothetical protein
MIILATDTLSQGVSTRKGSLLRYPKYSIRAFSSSLSPPNSPSHPELLDGQGREQKL